MLDLNTPIFRSRGAVNDTGEHLGSKIQTWMILWRPIKPILDGRRETEDGVWFWTNLTQQGVILLDQDRLDFAESAKDLASGPAKERGWWFRMCPKEAHRARFGNADWEQLLRNLKRRFRAGQHWMLEKWRIWWRINWKQRISGYRKCQYQEGKEARECCNNTQNKVTRCFLYYNIVQIARLVFFRPWIPHSTARWG